MQTTQDIEITTQLERARETLGAALGLTQDISHSGLDVERISTSLAGAVRGVFAVKQNGIASTVSLDAITHAMNHLRDTLVLLQDVQSQDPGLEQTTSTVARVLALLYPISKAIESAIRPNSAPIPLTQPARATSGQDDDRRSDIRTAITVDIGIQSSTNFYTGFSQDISSGGLFVATYDIVDIGTTINVNFTIPGGPVLSLNGKVRWVREYNETTPDIEPGMGIQFRDLAADDIRAITSFMEQNPPMFYDDDE